MFLLENLISASGLADTCGIRLSTIQVHLFDIHASDDKHFSANLSCVNHVLNKRAAMWEHTSPKLAVQVQCALMTIPHRLTAAQTLWFDLLTDCERLTVVRKINTSSSLKQKQIYIDHLKCHSLLQ